jgi:protein Tob/BTG
LYSADRNTTNKVLVIVSKEQLCRSLERTEMNINGAMTPEVQAAAKFISTCLYGKLPRRRADIYGVEFSSALTRKFQGHWYLEAPSKGSAYRCIHFTSKEIDPVFQQAADAAGVLFNEVSENIPAELRIWIDPGEVSYQIGEKGTVSVLYRRNQLGQEEFGHDLVNHQEPTRHAAQTENQRLFTVAEFMSTKFGSMKNRGMRRNHSHHQQPANHNAGFRSQTPIQNVAVGSSRPESTRIDARHQQNGVTNSMHSQHLLLQQQLLIQQLALQNLQINPSSVDEFHQMQVHQQVTHPLLSQTSLKSQQQQHQEFMPDLQLHLTPRGGLKPSFTFNKPDDHFSTMHHQHQTHHHQPHQVNSRNIHETSSTSSFGFKDCWSSSSNRNSPHSDSNNHSGDDSGFDAASLDDDLDLDPLIFNQIASLRLET